MKRNIRILALLSLVLFVYYLVADRLTPYTSNVRVKAIVIEIVPEVSGHLAEVTVTNGQLVEAGDLLARIDQRPFILDVERLRAELQLAIQSVGAGSSGIEVSVANLAKAQANLDNSKVQGERIFQLERLGDVTKAKADDARSQILTAESQVAAATADLSRVQRQLGNASADNPQIRSATAQLGKAELALLWTELRAPGRGVVVDLTVGKGTFAQAGKPLMTFGSFDEIWVEAYLTENNLGRVKAGQPAEITLDAYPGRIFDGVVSSITVGVSTGRDAPGGLPRAQNEQAWMRNAQRFPVRIKMTGYEIGSETAGIHRLMNGQADVIVYTSNNWLMNILGAAWIRVNAWLSYAY